MKTIVAVNEYNAIGKDNKLLFRISADLKNFKNLTTGKVVVYGYKTLETFPNGKPLKNRTNIILTHKNIQVEGATIVHSVEEAFMEFKKYNTDDIFIIGGESIYNQFIDYCDLCYLTKVPNTNILGDKFFPELTDWKVRSCALLTENTLNYSYSVLVNPNVKNFPQV